MSKIRIKWMFCNSNFPLIQIIRWICKFELSGLHCTYNNNYFSMHQVRDHLKDYLDRSCHVLVDGQAENTDHNLYLLVIQCFEVCMCAYV